MADEEQGPTVEERRARVCRCVRYGAHFYYGVSCPVHGPNHPENNRVTPLTSTAEEVQP